MNTRGLSEGDACKIIRHQAMSKPFTAEEIADAVINANEIRFGSEGITARMRKAGPSQAARA